MRGAASQKPHRADSHIDDGLAQENDAFAAALRKADDAHVTTRHFATDHACSDKRIELSQTALEWLAGLPNQVLGARWERRGVQVIARQAGVAAREAGACDIRTRMADVRYRPPAAQRPHDTHAVPSGRNDIMNLQEGKHLSRAIWMAVAIAAAPVANAAPTLTPVGPLDTNVLGMSADGSVLVGTPIFGGYAFRWTREGGTENLGGIGGNVQISRDGTAIAANVLVDGNPEAGLWLGGQNWRPLGGLGTSGCPDFSDSYGINGDGSVVVGLGWDGCEAYGFRWQDSTGMVNLGSLEGTSSRANAVSADGSVIVGWDSAETGEWRGVRWVNGVESLLATPGGAFLGSANAVSADGSVIVGGEAGKGPTHNKAYVWTAQRGGIVIGMLPSDDQLAGAYAFAVSDDGRVVGGASGAQKRDAFVWTPTTGIFKLQDYLVDLGVQGLDNWVLDTVTAISSDGRTIAGWGYRGPKRHSHVQGWVIDGLPPFVDTDRDAILDPVDNCTLRSNADQRDTDSDGYGNRCDPDFNNDGIVNGADAAYMRSVFGTADPNADLNGDGIVDSHDLAILGNFFGKPPGPSGRVAAASEARTANAIR